MERDTERAKLETFDLKANRETTIPAPAGRVRVKVVKRRGRFKVTVLEGGKLEHAKQTKETT